MNAMRFVVCEVKLCAWSGQASGNIRSREVQQNSEQSFSKKDNFHLIFHICVVVVPCGICDEAACGLMMLQVVRHSGNVWIFKLNAKPRTNCGCLKKTFIVFFFCFFSLIAANVRDRTRRENTATTTISINIDYYEFIRMHSNYN